MRKPVELSCRRRINLVIIHIGAHLDAPLDGVELAEIAAMSRFHFHRVFAAMTGLTPAEYVFLARMSRAAESLRSSRTTVTQVALEVGFESGPALAKALRRFFGMSASEIRRAAVDPRLTLTVQKTPSQRRRKESAMTPPLIIDLPEQQVLCATERGRNNNDMGPAARRAFQRLFAGAQAMGVISQVSRNIAIAPDPPRGPDDPDQRFVAGYVVEGAMPPLADGLHPETIAAGRWAVFRHVGPYTTLWQAWSRAYREWVPKSGATLRDVPPFEHYVNEPTDVPPEALITDIYIPIV
ncbi:AraC family transcriptional regulator [Niveibacterium sp. SC-1]|uniref:AraC family transcriptional regulator n=1 Tax=Niveibacterium sp. SC-1 TaxID=3135646 RepID=UPI00311FF016